MWNPSTCDCKYNTVCQIYEYQDIKNCSCKKQLLGKLVLEFKDKLPNATENLLNDKKSSMCKK